PREQLCGPARQGHRARVGPARLRLEDRRGIIGAFAAREVFVSTLGLVYGIGEVDDEAIPLRDRLRDEKTAEGRPKYSALTGLSLLVFFALACQCMSTLAVVRRETHTWRWPLFMFAYMTGLAWLASFLVYQLGSWLGA
ncbi:MAG TPA: hypothetical protein VK524_00180, partial [Polyangiaceae bacterium]|nr:hypothetical protein [Polyangiaceae bacterium]